MTGRTETKPDFIPIARPVMGEAEAEAARRPILKGWVTQGPEVAAFEREFAALVGAPYACAVSNCTTALHLALLTLGVGAGDEVITVSHSFIATANAIRQTGALPVFVDIDPATYNLNPALIEAAITERTRAILAVHQMGMPCDLATILPVARAHGLPVIEDAACAAGSQIRLESGDAARDAWEYIGKPHGDIACFSFHPRKVITTGDGGMITTANAAFDARFRLLRQHGMSVSDVARHGSPQVIFESYEEPGYNYRMTDIQASVGREQLRRLPDIITRRRELAARYAARLRETIPALGLPFEPAWARSNWQTYAVRLPDGADQRAVMQHMLDLGVATRRGIMNSHREPAYPRETWSCAGRVRQGQAGGQPCDCAPFACRALRESEIAQDRVIALPLFPQMTEAEQDRVIEALRQACAEVRPVGTEETR